MALICHLRAHLFILHDGALGGELQLVVCELNHVLLGLLDTLCHGLFPFISAPTKTVNACIAAHWHAYKSNSTCHSVAARSVDCTRSYELFFNHRILPMLTRHACRIQSYQELENSGSGREYDDR